MKKSILLALAALLLLSGVALAAVYVYRATFTCQVSTDRDDWVNDLPPDVWVREARNNKRAYRTIPQMPVPGVRTPTLRPQPQLASTIAPSAHTWQFRKIQQKSGWIRTNADRSQP